MIRSATTETPTLASVVVGCRLCNSGTCTTAPASKHRVGILVRYVLIITNATRAIVHVAIIATSSIGRDSSLRSIAKRATAIVVISAVESVTHANAIVTVVVSVAASIVP